MSAALECIGEEGKDKKDKPVGTLVKFRELVDQGRNGAVPMHPAERARLKNKVASVTSDLEI